jgi:co-chaperonin GroES (HSP10)
MAETQIILQRNQIILTQTESQLSITFDNSPYQNGEVVQINDLEDTYKVGDIVTYDPTGSTNFKYSGTDYVLITNEKILYREGAPL